MNSPGNHAPVVRDSTLILFTRLPEPGCCKTRLIGALGAEGACRLHQAMTLWTLRQARIVAGQRPLRIEVHHAGGQSEELQQWLGPGLTCRRQIEGDLGARMHRSLADALERGTPKALLIGTDAPGLDAPLLLEVLDVLDRHRLVLVPAEDGGFCLIGSAGPLPAMSGIAWGTSEVLEQVLSRGAEQGLDFHLTRPVRDIDRPEDLKYLPRKLLEESGLEIPDGLQ